MSERFYNLADQGFLENPAPMLAQMRADGPLVRVKLPIVGKMWVTTTYAATEAVAKGKDTFFITGEGAGLKKKGNAALPWWAPSSMRAMANNMLGKDDPEHRRLRKLVDQAFGRRGIQDMRTEIACAAQRRVAALGTDRIDVVPGFCRAFPLDVIADLLGVPLGARGAFAQFVDQLGAFDGLVSVFRAIRAISKLNKFVRQLVVEMRENPTPGLIDELIKAEAAGDRLTEEELVSMIFLLLFAGFETTTNLIAGSIVALDQNPDQRAWLLEDFDNRVGPATEELCRYVSSVAGTKPRICAHDTTVEGQPISKGDKIMALPVAANFDPTVFYQPDVLQLDRFPNPHLAFSTGNHFCLGMQLARVELQEALRALYKAHPSLPVMDTQIDYIRRPGHRAIRSLNVRLGA